jgi:fumarate hydratase class II
MGEMQVPNDKLYGCQTARSMKNFPIGGEADKMPRQIIQVTLLVILKSRPIFLRPLVT